MQGISSAVSTYLSDTHPVTRAFAGISAALLAIGAVGLWFGVTRHNAIYNILGGGGIAVGGCIAAATYVNARNDHRLAELEREITNGIASQTGGTSGSAELTQEIQPDAPL